MASAFGGSLRLALKQSLAETGHLAPKKGAKGEKRRRGRPPKATKKKTSKKSVQSSSYSESLMSSSSSSSLSSIDDVVDSGSYSEPVVKNDEFSSYDMSSYSTEERELEDDFPVDAMRNSSSTERASQKLIDKHKKHISRSTKQQLRLKAGKKRKRDDQSLFSSSAGSSKKSNSKKSSSKARTVTPPTEELVTWMQSMPDSELRRNISVGHRVKVRFDLKSKKKDGTRRYRWYGGRVAEVLKGGKRIRIVYDDGTKEVSSFPDYDVIVDDENNGAHHVSATAFFPLSDQSSEEDQGKISVPLKKMPQKEIDLDDRFEEVSVNMDNIVTSRTPLTDINSEHLSSTPSNKASTVTESSFSMPNSSSSSNHDSSESSCSGSSLGYDSTLKQSNQSSEPPRISISCTPKEPAETVTRTVPSLTIKLIPPKKIKPSVVDDCSLSKDSESSSDVQPNSTMEQEPISKFYKSKHWKSKKLKKSNSFREDKTFDAPTEISCHMPFSMKEAKDNRKRNRDSNLETPKSDTKVKNSGKLNAEKYVKRRCSNESNQSSCKAEQEFDASNSTLRKPECEDSVQPEISGVLPEDSSNGQDLMFAGTDSNISDECVMDTSNAHDTNPNSIESTEINVDPKAQSARSGRRAAQKAIERIAAKEIVLVDEYITPKKKREKVDLKLFPPFPVGNESSSNSMQADVEEEPWVQCDRCLKWRLLPKTVQMEELPERWYCELNIHDSKRNNCDAPEQTAEEVAACKALSSNAKSVEIDPAQNFDNSVRKAGATDTNIDGTKPTSIETPKEHSVSPHHSNSCSDARLSPSPSRDSNLLDSGVVKSMENKKENRINIKIPSQKQLESNTTELVPQSDPSTPTQADLVCKNTSVQGEQNSIDVLELNNAISESAEGMCGNKRFQLGKSKQLGKETGTETKISEEEDKDLVDNQEWVQCDKCKKWRMLPLRISAEDLPDIWYCTMNTWDVAKASCGAEEVKLESKVRECAMVNGRPAFTASSVSGKVSYRYLIFGTGKKLSRATSERARAVDSLFATCPTEQSPEGPSHSRFMYSTSSAFKPKLFNAHKKSFANEAGSGNFLDFMSKSNLWNELNSDLTHYQPSLFRDFDYSMDLRFKRKASSERKDGADSSLRDIIVNILGSSSLAVHEIYLNCLSEIPENEQDKCSLDHIIFSLEELLKEGMVEVAQDNSVLVG